MRLYEIKYKPSMYWEEHISLWIDLDHIVSIDAPRMSQFGVSFRICFVLGAEDRYVQCQHTHFEKYSENEASKMEALEYLNNEVFKPLLKAW